MSAENSQVFQSGLNILLRVSRESQESLEDHTNPARYLLYPQYRTCDLSEEVPSQVYAILAQYPNYRHLDLYHQHIPACKEIHSLVQNRPRIIALPLTSPSFGTRFSRNQTSRCFSISSQTNLEKSSCRCSSFIDMMTVSVGCDSRKDRRSARTATKVFR
jgi:hypothetical protein